MPVSVRSYENGYDTVYGEIVELGQYRTRDIQALWNFVFFLEKCRYERIEEEGEPTVVVRGFAVSGVLGVRITGGAHCALPSKMGLLKCPDDLWYTCMAR